MSEIILLCSKIKHIYRIDSISKGIVFLNKIRLFLKKFSFSGLLVSKLTLLILRIFSISIATTKLLPFADKANFKLASTILKPYS